jgi:hypothetical protein
MNKKLQAAVEQVVRELQERYPGVSAEIYPYQRKAAYVYVMPPEHSVWDGEGVWDIIEEMAPRQADRLIETGYHILLVPRFRRPPIVDVAALRERAALWLTRPDADEDESSAN